VPKSPGINEAQTLGKKGEKLKGHPPQVVLGERKRFQMEKRGVRGGGRTITKKNNTNQGEPKKMTVKFVALNTFWSLIQIYSKKNQAQKGEKPSAGIRIESLAFESEKKLIKISHHKKGEEIQDS